MNIHKNQEYIVDIIDNGFEGEGIAKIDNFTIFIPNAIKGEKIKIVVLKVNKNYAYAKILEILKPADSRVLDTDCSTFWKCGGCSLRHIKYKNTLKMKQDIVKNCLSKAINEEISVNETIGMENPIYYRNKLQYPLGKDENGNIVMGVYANRTHRIIQTSNCNIQDKKSQDIANDVFNFIKNNNIEPYNEKTQTGVIRHIIIKIGKRTNQVMLIMVVNDKFKLEKEFVQYITKKHNIKTILKNINKENTNVILGKENIVLFGDGYIQDILGEYKFNISPLAFYQVNPVQTVELYNTAIQLANLKGEEVVYDLYCGIGTISIFLSRYVKKVYGIEIIKEAVLAAKENARINNINNVEFFSGDVENVLPNILSKEKADVVFVDPPRKGLDANTIENLIKISPEKIVYISCNPATLARDLKMLSDKYKINVVQPLDMFPYTSHVECCSVLCLKDSIQ